MHNKLFLYILNGIQKDASFDLKEETEYSISNNFEHDIFLDVDNDFILTFVIKQNEIIIMRLETETNIICKGAVVATEQKFNLNSILLINGIQIFIGFDLNKVAENDFTSETLPKITEFLDEGNLYDSLINDENGEKKKKISAFFYYKVIIKIQLVVKYISTSYKNVYKKFGYWLYVLLLAIILLITLTGWFSYQYISAEKESQKIINELHIKKQIANTILNLPVKFHGIFLEDEKDNRYLIGGVIRTQSDLDELKNILHAKLKGVNVVYNVRLFQEIEANVLKIMKQYGILNPQIEVFNDVDVGISLSGVATNPNDIDNLLIDIRNNLNYVDQINTDNIILKKQIDSFFNAIPESIKDQLDISEHLVTGSIDVSGMLNDKQIEYMQEKVDEFNRKYKNLIHANANFQNIISSLPFYIIEVHTSNPKLIVTNDGSILYVGATYKGVTVLDISEQRVRLYKNFPINLDINDIMELALDHTRKRSNNRYINANNDKSCNRNCIIKEEQKKLEDNLTKEKREIDELQKLEKTANSKDLKANIQNNIENLKSDIEEKNHEYNYYHKEGI